MKRTKNVIILLTALLLCVLTLSGCGGYSSHFSAVAYVHSNSSKKAVMNFYEFTGTQAFTLKAQSGEQIKYTAKLETGKADVYYDCGDGKVLLFTVNGGDEYSGQSETLPSGKVYIIFETDGKCSNGSFEFNIE